MSDFPTLDVNAMSAVTGGVSPILGVCQGLDRSMSTLQSKAPTNDPNVQANDAATRGYLDSTMSLLSCRDRIVAAGGQPMSSR